jgi:hypothetical protein
MKNARTGLARWRVAVIVMAGIILTGCAAQKENIQAGQAPGGPVYDTTELILDMPPCKAKVVERGPCFVYLRAADGNGFYIGIPAAGAEVVDFLHVLKDGQTYKFPDTFQKYQEQRRRRSS